jgi:hypothetical protein
MTQALVVFAASYLAWASATGANIPVPVIDPEVRSAITSGAARIILELRINLSFQAEGERPVSSQRDAIAAVQAATLARLSGSRFELIHRYESLPLLALEVGPDALMRLESSGDLIVRIVPDAVRMPSPRPSSP